MPGPYDKMEPDEYSPIVGGSRRGPPVKERNHLIRSCIVEFIGDLIFVFVGGLSATANTDGVTGAAFAHGVAIFVLIASMGHISGGHFNPAVTLGVTIVGGIHYLEALFYMASQLLGGFIGALFLRAATHGDIYEKIKGGLTLPTTDYAGEAFCCEAIFTYLLVMTVLLTAVDTDTNLLAPLAIGMSILVDIFAGGNVSGASMNPARSLGPSIAWSIFGTDKYDAWSTHWIYWIGPGVGSALAGLVYKAFLANDTKRWLFKD